MNISILGGGSWGIALAVHFILRHQVTIWEFFPDKALEMQVSRKSSYLENATIPENIKITSTLDEVIKFGDIVIVAVPSDKVAETLEKCQNLIDKKTVIICSKGFSLDGRLLSEVAKQYISGSIYCLYGPSIADEVYNFKFTGLVLAGLTKNEMLRKILEDENLRIEMSDDLIGVQIAATLKNILAIYVGMLEGMGLGENAKAYVISKGLPEIMDFGYILGANKDTFCSIAGIGDIITTCYSEKSRNRTFGEQIGKGMKMEQILSNMPNVVEGVLALKNVQKIAVEKNINMPLIEGLYKVIFEDADPLVLLRSLT